MAIKTTVENFSGAILKVLAASNPKSRQRDNPRLPIPADIKDEIRQKNRLWQINRNSALRAEVGDQPVQRVEELPVEGVTPILPSRRPVAVGDDQTGDERAYSTSPTGHPGGNGSQALRKPKPLPTVCRLSFSQ